MPPTTENRVHLFRLQILIIDGGLLVLRNILDQTLTAQGTTLVACLNTEKATITQLRSKGIITQLQNDILFPSGGRVPNTKDLDITLIVSLLRGLKCFGLNSRFDWKTVPSSSDVSLEADIWRLNAYRNKLCHLRKATEVQPTDFTTWWNDIEKILLRLNLPPPNIQDVINDYMTCSLDTKKERIIKNEIVKKEAIINRLQEDVNIMETEMVELKKRQEDDTGKMENMEKLRKAEEKILLDFLVNHGEELNVTRNNQEFNAVLVLYDDAIDKPIIHRVEKHVKMACTQRRITNTPDIDEELVTKFIEMVSGIESATDAKVIGEDKRCIIIKFRCESNEQLVKLLQYFDSDDLQNQLEELAKIVKQRIKTDKSVYFSLRLSSNCLERILEEIAGEGLESNTVLKDEDEKNRQLRKERKSVTTEEEEHLQDIKEEIEEIGIESSTTQRPEEEKYEQFKKERKSVTTEEEEHLQDIKEEIEEIGIESSTTQRPEEEKYEQFKKEEIHIESRTTLRPEEEKYRQIKKEREDIEYRVLKTEEEKYRQTKEESKSVKTEEEEYLQGIKAEKDIASSTALKTEKEKYLQLRKAGKEIASGTALKTEKETYLQRKKDLKDDMITFYNTRHSKVPPLESFYPRPVKIEKMLATKHGIQQVESLSDMFKSKSTIIREIYTTSYDGLGKNTFSKYIAITWCQAHCSKEKDKASFEKDDIDCMHGFEFVFIVSLQDSYDLFSIDNLIFELIVSKLARSEKFDCCFLQEILNREKCLVILDGLDELTLPEDPGKPTSGTPRSILHRNDRKRYIIFSTTRPWTLGVFNPRSSMALGKLAYHTLFNNKLILDRSLAQKYLNEGDMKLSFLLEILTESQTEPVSFSEKKVQEFFAATFISSQSDGKKIVLKNCNSVQDILDMSTICQFISKMNATMMCEISEGFMSVINEYEETRVNRIRTEDVYLPLYHLQNMLVSCLKEMPENENIQMCLQDMFISCHSEQDLKGLSKVNKCSIKSLYIDSSETSRSLREIIELYSLIDLNYLQKLYFIGNAKDADLNRLLSQCLQSLSLSWGKWTTCKENLSEQLEQMQNLQYLYICAFTFSHKILELFLNSISSKRTLKEVTLTQIYCNEHGDDCERMKLDLSQHFQLKEVKLFELPPLELNIKTPSLVDVELSSINLDESSLLLSPEMLNIESVMLTDLEMSAESLQNNVNVLENLPHSVEVVINECRIGPETERKLFENYILNAETFDVKVDDYLYGWNFVFNTRKPSGEFNNIKK